jgi:hypothetical protein
MWVVMSMVKVYIYTGDAINGSLKQAEVNIVEVSWVFEPCECYEVFGFFV